VELDAWELEDAGTGVAWKISQSPGNRVIRDILALWDGYASKHITQEDFLRCCMVKIGEAAKAIHASSGASMKDVERELDAYAVRGEVRETMRRVR